MKYRVVHSINLDRFEDEVNKLLENGWGLKGEIVVSVGNIYQVMVKDD